MKQSYKLGLAAIAVSVLLVGCGGGSDTPTNPPVSTDPGAPEEVSLGDFVSGNNLIHTAEVTGTFASDGYCEEDYPGSSDFCNGTWDVLDNATIEVICTEQDGIAGATDSDRGLWELKDGMQVVAIGHDGTITVQSL